MTFALWALPVAGAWPVDDAWLPVNTSAGQPVAEPEGDAPAGLDLASAPGAPVLSWAADAEQLFVRLRLTGTADPQSAYGLLVESGGDPILEGVVLAVPGTAVLQLWPNVDATPGVDPGFTDLGAPIALSGNVRFALDPLGGEHVDLALDRSQLPLLGITDAGGFRVAAVTTTSPWLPHADVSGCAVGPSSCPTHAVLGAPLVIDGDSDGATASEEEQVGTSSADADSDDDGVPDGLEHLGDSDGDGAPDGLDCDADDDGVLDGVELGLTTGTADTWPGVCFAPDADPSTTTDPTLADSDGGGRDDGAEDADGDGAVGPWETDPSDPWDDLDSDGDGIPDVLELLGPDGLVDDGDSDGDDVPDAVEGLADPDGDGLPAFLDEDSDGDGLPDALEGSADSDGDGLPDVLDLDSDGDGLSDTLEGAGDWDGDGLIDAVDLDSDGDGVPDAIEGGGDTDGDGIPDRHDGDSDGDGLTDDVEGPGDADGDGVPNIHEGDSDADGLPDAFEGDGDPDRDGLGNFEDLNSDGRGSWDGAEGAGDEDCDGVPDYLDADHEDGFCGERAPTPEILPAPPTPPPADAPTGCTAAGSVPGGRSGLALFGLWALAARRARRVTG